jgi:hypothetical protein
MMSKIHAGDALTILNQRLPNQRLAFTSRPFIFLDKPFMLFNQLLLPSLFENLRRGISSRLNLGISLQINDELIGEVWNVHRRHRYNIFVPFHVLK